MPDQTDKKRQRNIKRTVRLTTFEDALLVTNADIAGLTVASYMRQSSLAIPACPAARRPTVSHRLAIRLLAEVGRLTTAFDQTACRAVDIDALLIETAMRDVSEMRLVLLETVGRAP